MELANQVEELRKERERDGALIAHLRSRQRVAEVSNSRRDGAARPHEHGTVILLLGTPT